MCGYDSLITDYVITVLKLNFTTVINNDRCTINRPIEYYIPIYPSIHSGNEEILRNI